MTEKRRDEILRLIAEIDLNLAMIRSLLPPVEKVPPVEKERELKDELGGWSP